MPFLHPAIAWSALGLASIPIIIHLLNRRRLRRLDWAAMEFLLAALKRTRRKIRIEQLLLLLVRITLMALLGLFIARPMLSDSEFSWLASALKKEEKLFVLDDSLSMALRHADGNVFARGVDAIATEVNRLGRRRAGDIVSVVRTSRSGAPPPGVFINQDSAAELEQTVKSFSPTSARMDLAATLERIAERAATTSGGGPQHPRSISIVTDLRAIDWTDGAGGPSAALTRAFERLAENDENPPRLLVFDVGSDDSANVAVTEVALLGGRPTLGLPTEVRVEVRNFGRETIRDLRLAMTFGQVGAERDDGAGAAGTALAPGIDRLDGGETVVATIPCTFRSSGQYWARVEVSGNQDALPQDNSLAFVVDVVEATDALVLSGEPSSEPWEGESDYLVSVLDPDGETSEGIRPTVASEDNPPEDALEKYAAIFLTNVHGLDDGFRRRVGRYVRGGGSLVMFLGDQVDAAEYRRQFGEGDGASTAAPANGSANASTSPAAAAAARAAAIEAEPWRGLLPARLGEITGGELTNVTIAPSWEHPYFRSLRGEAERYLEQVSFRKYWTLEPLPATRVIARFTDGAGDGALGSPAIVERAVGDGTVLLFASSADDEWNDWPRNGTYVVLLRDILESIARSRAGAGQHLAGQSIDLPVDVSRFQLEARVRSPDYPRTPETALRAAPAALAPSGAAAGAAGAAAGNAAADGELRFRLDPSATIASGVIRVAYAPRGGGDASWRAIAIRSDPAESDLTRLAAARLEELYPDAGLRVLRDAASFTEAGRGQFEIADVLIALFALLLLVEGVLACRFAHHQRAAGGQLASSASIPTLRQDAIR